MYSVAISYDYNNINSEYSSKSDSLIVQNLDYESQNINDLSPLNTFLYPKENVELKPPFIKKIGVFWEAVWVSHITTKYNKNYIENGFFITPLSARILLEKSYIALHIKVMPYIGHINDSNHEYSGEEMFYIEEGTVALINYNVDVYFRFINRSKDKIIWVGSGLHLVYPVMKVVLNIPFNKHRFQISGGFIFDYGGHYHEELDSYTFSFNFERSPTYNSKYVWGMSGGVILPFHKREDDWFDNRDDIDIWLGGMYGIF